MSLPCRYPCCCELLVACVCRKVGNIYLQQVTIYISLSYFHFIQEFSRYVLVTKCPGLLRQPKFKSNNTYPTQTEKRKKRKKKEKKGWI